MTSFFEQVYILSSVHYSIIANICFKIENLRLCSSAVVGIVLSLI